jgi:hypothetical protein
MSPSRSDTFLKRCRPNIRGMESPILAAQSVPADVSEFFRAELEAFIAMSRRLRPTSWARVEKLQQVCRIESPASSAGLSRSVRLLRERTAA